MWRRRGMMPRESCSALLIPSVPAVVIKGAQAICTSDRSTQLYAHTSITHIKDRFEQPQAALAA